MSGAIAVVERFGRCLAGVPLTGDPVIDAAGQRDLLLARRACQYAAAMVFGRSALFLEDLATIDAVFDGVATVVFIRADAGQAEVARFTIPERVLRFDPAAPAVRLGDAREAS